MKHDKRTTIKLMAWVLFACVFGITLSIAMPRKEIAPQGPWTIGIIIAISILVGTIMWLGLLKYQKKMILPIFSVAMAMGTSGMLAAIVPHFATSFLARLAVASISALSFYWCVMQMRESWEWTRRLMWVSNIYIIIVTTFVAAQFSQMMAWYVALALLAVAAIYDGIAVWKTKHMQSMAMQFIDRRIIPGIAIAKKQKNKFAILGGGDVFFIVLVAGSAVTISMDAMFAVAGGMLAALAILFVIGNPKKFYPALPFLFAGALVGFAIVGVAMKGGTWC